MDAGKRTINDIFNGNRVLEIPFFQRAYVWGEEQWERMLEDMELISSLNKPYFMGSVILKQQGTNSGSGVGDIRTLIDGQQRLTTLNIFFKVLCLKTGKNSSFDRRFRLENESLALWHNHNDIDAFQRVLDLPELTPMTGNDNIIEAYEYFREKIDPSKLDRQRLLNNIVFVGIDLGKDEDEQQIFDTINSLGVRLTTAELLKNHLFDRGDLEMFDAYWKNIFEKDETTKAYWDREVTTGRIKRTFIDLFFYAYLQIKIQQPELGVKAEEKNDYARVESLFESYKQFIKRYHQDKKLLLVEIRQYAEKFRNNFDYDVVNRELPAEPGIERINGIIFGLETSTLIPYVLYILQHVPEKNQRDELFGFLETYLLRRMVVRANTRNYNQLFTDRLITNQILSKAQFQEYLIRQNDKINYLPGDEELQSGFDRSVLVNRQAAGILYFLESRIRDRNRHSTQLLGLRQYSLEHLMPKKWENNWPRPTDKEQIDYRNSKLKTLGNLAIISQSLNTSIRDADWDTKKRGRGKKGGLKDFSGGIQTLTPYLEIEDWTEQEIEKRGRDLFQLATEIWK